MVYLGDLGEEENVLGSRHCRSRAFLREKNSFKSLLALLCTFVALTSSAHSADAAPATSPYDVLGIDKTASERDVKRAYRAKSLEFHPDKNNSPDATEKFREVAEAAVPSPFGSTRTTTTTTTTTTTCCCELFLKLRCHHLQKQPGQCVQRHRAVLLVRRL